MNPVSMSTMEMAPSAREEVIDDHWGSWNWQKTLGFGMCLLLRLRNSLTQSILIGALFLKHLREAFLMSDKHNAIFEDLTASFPAQTIAKWKADAERWDSNPTSKPDPFTIGLKGM